MLKYLIYFALGYLVFKIVKNGVYLAVDSFKDPKEIRQSDTLVQCTNCEKYFDRQLAIIRKKHFFCSDECQTEFFSEKS